MSARAVPAHAVSTQTAGRSYNGGLIKVIAAVTMLIDHTGHVFFPSTITWRIIGRIAFPLFAFCVAKGFYYSWRKGTVIRYLLHMLIFAAVSQWPFMLMVNIRWTRPGIHLNIGFTWLFALMVMYGLALFFRGIYIPGVVGLWAGRRAAWASAVDNIAHDVHDAAEPLAQALQAQALRSQPLHTPHLQGNLRADTVKHPGTGDSLRRIVSILAGLALILAPVIALDHVSVDYGMYGIAVAVIFWLAYGASLRFSRWEGLVWVALVMSFYGLTWAWITWGNMSGTQEWSILALGALLAYRWDTAIRVSKWFFYVFYPLHMALLVALWQLLR